TETDDRLVDAMSWLAVAPEPVDPVVESLFEKGDKIAVFGKSKTRKSFFVLQLAFSLVAGRDFIGMAIPTRRRVLLIQLEIKPSHMHRRCRAMAYALGVEHIEGLHIFNGRGANLTEGAIIRLARDTQADVVIVDPIYKLGTLDESSEPMAAVMRMFDQVIEATGASLIYVHHDKKGSSGDLDLVDRGSGSGIVGRDYDSAMFLTPHVDGKAVVIEYITRNHPPQGGTVARFEDGCFNVDGMAPVQVETSRSQATRRSKGETVQQLVERAIEMMTPGEKILKAEFRSRLESSGVAINKAKEITTIICERPDFESTIAKGFPAKYYIERLTASTTGTGGTNE
ncbi:MAG TPA: hypothetical protein DCS43_07955, partial [Verrucomicrobia bacterium]|nr:hypothetical protein [Verrucomicrobiota bacterium]